MVLSNQQRAILRNLPHERQNSFIERLITQLRGFGSNGRGPESNGRGLISGDLGPNVIENFEDGDVSDWSGTNFAAVQTTNNSGSAYNMSWMMELYTSSGSNVSCSKTIPEQSPQYLAHAWRIENATSGEAARGHADFFRGGSVVLSVRGDSRDSNMHVAGSQSSQEFANDKWWFAEYENIDWGTDTVGTVYLNGTQEFTNQPLENSANGIDELTMIANGTGDHQTYSDYWIAQY
jgi:hypothetical protein